MFFSLVMARHNSFPPKFSGSQIRSKILRVRQSRPQFLMFFLRLLLFLRCSTSFAIFFGRSIIKNPKLLASRHYIFPHPPPSESTNQMLIIKLPCDAIVLLLLKRDRHQSRKSSKRICALFTRICVCFICEKASESFLLLLYFKIEIIILTNDSLPPWMLEKCSSS